MLSTYRCDIRVLYESIDKPYRYYHSYLACRLKAVTLASATVFPHSRSPLLSPMKCVSALCYRSHLIDLVGWETYKAISSIQNSKPRNASAGLFGVLFMMTVRSAHCILQASSIFVS